MTDKPIELTDRQEADEWDKIVSDNTVSVSPPKPSYLWISETFRNATEGYLIHDGDPQESYHVTRGELFTALQKEHGRCIGHVYIDDRNDDDTVTVYEIGWVFVKRVEYRWRNGKSDGSYLQETWVSVHTAPPTHTVTFHYDKREARFN
jgi:hypothetical protein